MPPKRTKSNLPRGLVERAGGQVKRKLGLYIDADIGRRFHLKCVSEQRDMSEVVEGLIAAWLKTK